MTELDKALKEANENVDKRSDYYHLFLNSQIYIPTYDVPTEVKDERAKEDKIFNPIIVVADGKPHLMLFDTVEKLSAWAQKDVGVIGFVGYLIFDSISDENLTWILNYGTEYSKVFSQEEVRNIRNYLQKGESETFVMEKGLSIGIGDVDVIPEGMVDALKKVAKLNKEIDAIYLGTIILLEKEDKPHFALVLQTDGIDEGVQSIISEAIHVGIRGNLSDNEYIDILFDDGDGISKDIIKKAKLVYKR